MAEFKYVVLSNSLFHFPIIFPDKLVHADVARALVGVTPGKKVKVTSAGFLLLQTKVQMDQKSETLRLGPDPDDERMINNYIYGHGIR